jgi:hypothetical protein
MSDDRRYQSRLLILRPHPWAYHPSIHTEAADAAAGQTARPSMQRQPRTGEAAGPEAPPRGWREYVATRFAALERQVQRLGHTSRDWIL